MKTLFKTLVAALSLCVHAPAVEPVHAPFTDLAKWLNNSAEYKITLATNNNTVNLIAPLGLFSMQDSMGALAVKSGGLFVNSQDLTKAGVVFVYQQNTDTNNRTYIGFTPSSVTGNASTSVDIGVGSSVGTTNGSSQMRVIVGGTVFENNVSSDPDSKAIVEFRSTSKGVLFKGMTGTQRDTISSPPDGLVIFNTSTSKLQVRAGGAWVDLH